MIGKNEDSSLFERAVAFTEDALQPSLISRDRFVGAVRWREIVHKWRSQIRVVIRRFGNAERLIPGLTPANSLR